MKKLIPVSNDMREVINVEQLFACIDMLDCRMHRIRDEWYPKELMDAINEFHFRHLSKFKEALIGWIINNTDAED